MIKKTIIKELILLLSAFISTILSGWSIYHFFVFYLLYTILWEIE